MTDRGARLFGRCSRKRAPRRGFLCLVAAQPAYISLHFRAIRLIPRQRLFVDFYLQKQNGAWAARKAGYEESRARFTARDLLTNRHIQLAIREGFEALLEEQRLEAGRILREQARLAFSDLTNIVNWDEEG